MSDHDEREAPTNRLIDFERVQEMLDLPAEDVQWLVDTGQLPEIVIRGRRRFDLADLGQLIEIYKKVQRKERNHEENR